VSLWLSASFWHPIHKVRDVSAFEVELNAMPRRWEYDWRMLQRARQAGRLVVGEHAGFFDVFAPIQHDDGIEGVLVVGPCAVARPTSAELTHRWYELCGSPARLSDPLFARYLSTTFATLTLEGSAWEHFQHLVSCFARLLGGQGEKEALAVEMVSTWRALQPCRFPERMWEATRNLLEERSARSPPPLDHGDMAAFGLERTPTHVVVGLLMGRNAEADPIANRIQIASFQHACASFARKQGHTLCGRVADRGVVFLVDDPRASSRSRVKLSELVSRANVLARGFGLRFHAGIQTATESDGLPTSYRSALWAAERALAEGRSFVQGDPGAGSSVNRLRELRAELVRSAAEPPHQLATRFDAYVEAVLTHTGYRFERVKSQLEAGIERLADALFDAGLWDKNAVGECLSTLEKGCEAATTVADLLAAYRRAVADIERVLRSPTAARHDRGIARAVTFMSENVTTPLTLHQAARTAGFAPDYFGRLFRREKGITFERYWQKLRIDRAKELIDHTSLAVDAICRLSGFRTRTHFHTAFKKVVGVTPTQYRRRGW
jgi:AraC-like DNA-binding protein